MQAGRHRRGAGERSDGRRINVGGEKVYPADVVNVLLQMDNICDATVYGRPNPVTGRVVAAVVSLIEPEDPDRLEQRMLP